MGIFAAASGRERGPHTDGEVCPEMGWESPEGGCVAPVVKAAQRGKLGGLQGQGADFMRNRINLPGKLAPLKGGAPHAGSTGNWETRERKAMKNLVDFALHGGTHWCSQGVAKPSTLGQKCFYRQ